MLTEVVAFLAGWAPVGGCPLTAAVYLVPLAFFVVVFARSLVLTFGRRRVRWKGPDVAIGRAA